MARTMTPAQKSAGQAITNVSSPLAIYRMLVPILMIASADGIPQVAEIE